MKFGATEIFAAALRFSKYCNDSYLPGLVLIVLLTTTFYYPALFLGRTLAHGDIFAVDLPFFDLFSRVVAGKASALWSSGIFGGHPLFAEGQAGFAQPLNLLWAATVTQIVGPLYSMNLFYWLLKILGALGLIGLCRSLGISRAASTFAAIAVLYSAVWEHEHYVLPVNQTLAWMPWCLWAFEKWVKRPNLKSTGVLAAAASLVFLSGYPQGIHGAFLYAFATLVVVPFNARMRDEWLLTWRSRLVLGLTAGLLCIGLVAIQLLPSFELEGLSYRASGIGVSFAGATPMTSYLRGVLTTEPTSYAAYFPGTGSILVCALASIALVVPVSARIKGHIVATIFLFLLGTERASPLFRVVYDHHLIPGLHFFRQMVIYLSIAAIGVSVAAAAALDHLSKYKQSFSELFNVVRSHQCQLLLLLMLWFAAGLCLPHNHIVGLQIAITLIGVATFVALVRSYLVNLTAPVITLLLAAEIVALRLHPFQFFDSQVFARPPSVDAIQKIPDWEKYKFMTGSLAGVGAGLSPSLLPDLKNRINKAISAISPNTNLLWNIPSLNGHLALPLKRRLVIEDLLHEETFAVSKTPAGLRLIDFLAIRFVTNGGELITPAFRTIYLDNRPEMQTVDNREHWTQENTAAYPRFQIYTAYKLVDSLEQAILAVKTLTRPTLIIERLAGRTTSSSTTVDVDTSRSDNDGAAASFRTIKASDTEYQFDITAAKPVWFFLADANYPGWNATIDGRPAPVFSAQILGKAVLVPAGEHDLRLSFGSLSFLWGSGITAVSLVLLLVCLFQPHLFHMWWKRKGQSPADLNP